MKTKKEQALEIIKAIAELVSEEGRSLTISHDWDYGTGTLTNGSGQNTHIGCPWLEGKAAFESFLNGLYAHLCCGRGLSWHKGEICLGRREETVDCEFKKKEDSQYECQECFEKAYGHDLLRGANPFNENGKVIGCPSCFEIGRLNAVCDIEGCEETRRLIAFDSVLGHLLACVYCKREIEREAERIKKDFRCEKCSRPIIEKSGICIDCTMT